MSGEAEIMKLVEVACMGKNVEAKTTTNVHNHLSSKSRKHLREWQYKSAKEAFLVCQQWWSPMRLVRVKLTERKVFDIGLENCSRIFSRFKSRRSSCTQYLLRSEEPLEIHYSFKVKGQFHNIWWVKSQWQKNWQKPQASATVPTWKSSFDSNVWWKCDLSPGSQIILPAIIPNPVTPTISYIDYFLPCSRF